MSRHCGALPPSLPLVAVAAILLTHHLAVAQQTPTQRLNAQREEAARRAAQQAAEQRRVQTRRLQPPCVVPESYYPLRTCAVTTSASICGRGWNAWSSFQECCIPGRNGAFPAGCTDFTRNVTCWIPGEFFPCQTCVPTNNLTRCSYNWGRWESEESCCARGAAHPDGCTKVDPCWVATEWSPSRRCSMVADEGTCTRGWGAYDSEEACCELGAAFSDGCFDYDAAAAGSGVVPEVRPLGQAQAGDLAPEFFEP